MWGTARSDRAGEEALTRLAEQGLLVASPQRGFSVRELSVGDLADLTHVRVQIESLAFGQAVRNGDVAWETAVAATHHTLQRTPTMLPAGRFNEAWSVAHRAFHLALLADAAARGWRGSRRPCATARNSTGGGTGR